MFENQNYNSAKLDFCPEAKFQSFCHLLFFVVRFKQLRKADQLNLLILYVYC